MTVFQAKYRTHFELCSELFSLALQASPSLPNLSKTYEEAITAFFIKALNSFRSVILLCEEGSGNDAAILVRSLLNLSYLVKWVEQDKNDRAQRFLGWYWKERIASVENIRPPTAKEKAEWEEVRHLFKDNDRYWYGNVSIRALAASLQEDTPPPPNYKSWAELHYLEGYKPLSHMEHSNPSASSAFFARAKGHYLIGYLSSDEMIHEALKGGFLYFHIIFDVWNSYYGMISLEILRKLRQTAREYFRRFENEEAERKVSLAKSSVDIPPSDVHQQ